MADLGRAGWMRFDYDPGLAAWAKHADSVAKAAESDPANAHWVRCGGTWFVGVDALPNDQKGRVQGGPPLTGAAFDAALAIAHVPLHRAQVSVIYPGYPKQGADEGEAAFGFRLKRDAAHVDGLHRIMPGRRRLLKERHAWLLGVPLSDSDAAPMTVWEGSHEIMRAALSHAFAGVSPADWAEHDVTDVYQAARRRCFEMCRRVELRAKVGEAYLVHRLALHGVAPWGSAPGTRRAIAYFRPEFSADWPADAWLTAP